MKCVKMWATKSKISGNLCNLFSTKRGAKEECRIVFSRYPVRILITEIEPAKKKGKS